MDDKLRDLVLRFFQVLDTTIISDSGKEYHPVYLSCTDTYLMTEMDDVMSKMKAMVKNGL